MSAAQADPDARRAAFWITGVSVYLFWNVATLLGAVVGKAIDPTTFGLDAAFPAGFVAMLWPLLGEKRGRLAAALGAVICVTLIPFLPVGVPILCAAAAVLVGVRR
jgi:predicted branched-subunit amino acid permease